MFRVCDRARKQFLTLSELKINTKNYSEERTKKHLCFGSKLSPVTWVNSGHTPLIRPLTGNVLNASHERLEIAVRPRPARGWSLI